MLLDGYYKEKYIIFLDIEFQNIDYNNQLKHYIRELGLIIFEKGIEKPVYIDHVNFPILHSHNVRLIGCDYSTVSKKTEEEMSKIESNFIIRPDLDDVKKKSDIIKYIPNGNVRDILRKALSTNDQSILDKNKTSIEKFAKKSMFIYQYNRLPTKYKQLFKQLNDLYIHDIEVKKRLVEPFKYLGKLNNYLSQGILIHKEETDLEALGNDSSLYNVKLDIKKRFDIAIFNPIIAKSISPTLTNSYLKVYDEKIVSTSWLLKYHNVIMDLVVKKMKKFRPHNPLVDAFMTIFVFIVYYK